MALYIARTRILRFVRPAGLFSALSLAVMAGGCAQVGVPDLPGMLSENSGSNTKTANAGADDSRSDLQKATAYWGKKFMEHPRNLDSALSYAMNLKAMGKKTEAMAVLQRSSLFHSDSRRLASEYGRLALDLGQIKVAKKVLALADDPAAPDWRVLSARGTVLAKQGQFAKAIPFFQNALKLKKDHPSLLSNLALAHAMNGDPQTAEGLLRQASAQGGATKKVRQNLALVLGLQGKYDEATQVSSHDSSTSQAVADTSLIRRIVLLPPTATPVPAPTQVAGDLKPTSVDPLPSSQAWASKVASTNPPGN